MSESHLIAEAGTLRDLVDVLIPGDELFPAASAVGAHGLLAERLRQQHGAAAIERVVAALDARADGASFSGLPPVRRVEAVRRLEEAEPWLFEAVRTILFYSYYQSPLVVRAIRALGHDYNDAPQPRGYAMTPFDPAPGGNVPASPRGGYKRTDEMRRVDLGPIADEPLAEEA